VKNYTYVVCIFIVLWLKLNFAIVQSIQARWLTFSIQSHQLHDVTEIDMPYYYAVKVGRIPGVYRTWDECEEQVKGFRNATYKKFNTKSEAERFANVVREPITSSRRLVDNKRRVGRSPSPVRKSYRVKKTTSIIDNSERGRRIERSRSKSPSRSRSRSRSRKSKRDHPDVGKPVMFGQHDIIVYTDGSCRGNGKPGAKAGYGVYSPTHPDITAYGPLEDWELHTNQRAELLAILVAIQRSPDTAPLQIITDSTYSIKCITEWSIKWEQCNWKVDKCNLDLVKAIVKAVKKHKHPIEFTHVKGHSGEFGNEEADRLANMGAEMA
jgi:ribonuclease HI